MVCNICKKDFYKILYQERKGGRYKYYSSGDYGRVVRCNNCGLIFINPRDKDIEKIYEEIEDKNYLKSKSARIETFKKDLKEIERYKKRGKILDIGCGPGLFLKVAKDKGWDGYGIELSKWGYNYGRNLGLNIINKNLEKANFRDDFFDVITLWDVIEHVEDPSKLLGELNRVLKRDGLVVLNTPNIGSLFAKICGKRWWNLMRMHIFYFDKKTIRKILGKNGLKVVKIKSYSRTIILRHAIGWFKTYKNIYRILKVIKKSKIGDLKLRVNTFDNMLVFAKKIIP